MRNTRRLLSLAMALLLTVCLLAGCGSITEQPDDSAETAGNSTDAATTTSSGNSEIHVGIDADPGSLAPWGTEGARNIPVAMIYETLTHMNCDGENEMRLAKELVKVDELNYDITIFDEIYDTAGNHMTADDVVFSFNKYIDSGFGTSYISSLKSIEKTGDYTVHITLKDDAKVGSLTTMLGKVNIITEAAWEQSSDEMVADPIGTMPYVVSDYSAGSCITYTKVDYWQKDESLVSSFSQSNIDTVYLDIITDRSTQALALQAGSIDATQFLNSADYGNFFGEDDTTLDGYTARTWAMSSAWYIEFNCSDNSPCSDINLRKAISYCIDKAEVAYMCKGSDGVAAYTYSSPVNADFDENYHNGYEYDIEEAQTLLAASSYAGETLKINKNYSFPADATTLIGSYLDALGVKYEVMNLEEAMAESYHLDESGTLYDLDINGRGTIGYTWCNLYDYDVNNYESGICHTFIADEKLQELYDAMASINTNSVDNTNAFMDYMVEQCYACPLCYYAKRIVAGPSVDFLAISEWGNVVPNACILK